MKTKGARLNPDDYPASQAYRGGCKVAWRYYASEADAKKASKLAVREARALEKQGFDWGYMVPGMVTFRNDGSQYTGLWEVCLP